MFKFLWYILAGFLCGLIARAVLPGADSMGYIATTVVGIVGSLIGGAIGGRLHSAPTDATFPRGGFIWSIIGAIILLVVLRIVT